MGRRRAKDPDVFEMVHEIMEFVFRVIPPWTSIPISVLLFLLIAACFSRLGNSQLSGLATLLVGGPMAIICLVAGFQGYLSRRKQSAFLEQEIDVAWVRGLTWRDFERQVADVYRQQGYDVVELGGDGPDGGIDLKLCKGGSTTLVQCKHWKSWKVGVKPIRELYGVMTAERADSCTVIASGRFTADAAAFAHGKPITLIGGPDFINLVRHFQRDLRSHLTPRTVRTPPNCPRCSSPMVLGTANTGKQKWECPLYPDCKGTIDFGA